MEPVYVLLSVLFVSGALSQDCNPIPALFITAPKEMEGLSGSCLLIPCKFRPNSEEKFSSTGVTFGVWIKTDSKFSNNPDNVIYNSSKDFNIYPLKITGNLTQRNCTTLFSNLTSRFSDKYFFRVEKVSFKATASCDPVKVTVKDSAPRPRIETPADLKEKQSVTITCSASTPCPHSPPKLTWSLQPDPHSSTEENTDGTFTTKIQQTITLSDKHDGYNISCSARFPVDEGKDVRTSETEETLRVSYSPKDTSASISPSGLVSAGTSVNLTCSSRARPPVSSYTWFKISQHGATIVSEGDVYRFNGTEGGAYYCVAANGLGNQTSPEIQLTIREETQQPFSWQLVVGGIIGFILFICVVAAVWRLKSKHPSPQTKNLTDEDPTPPEPGRTTEEENIHYGEIDFSSRRGGPSSSHSGLNSGQQEDTIYAQVKVLERANGSTPTADGPEDLYAQVKKK